MPGSGRPHWSPLEHYEVAPSSQCFATNWKSCCKDLSNARLYHPKSHFTGRDLPEKAKFVSLSLRKINVVCRHVSLSPLEWYPKITSHIVSLYFNILLYDYRKRATLSAHCLARTLRFCFHGSSVYLLGNVSTGLASDMPPIERWTLVPTITKRALRL